MSDEPIAQGELLSFVIAMSGLVTAIGEVARHTLGAVVAIHEGADKAVIAGHLIESLTAFSRMAEAGELRLARLRELAQAQSRILQNAAQELNSAVSVMTSDTPPPPVIDLAANRQQRRAAQRAARKEIRS